MTTIRRSVAWAFSGQFLSFVAAFGGSIIVARLLSPHEMGIFAIAMATLGVIQVFVAFGVGAYIVRETDLQPHTLDAAFTVNAILAILLSGVILLASFGGGWLLGDPAAGRVLRVSAIGPLIGLFQFRSSVMLQRESQFKTISIITVASSLVTTLTTVTCAIAGFSYMSPAYGGVASALFGTAAYILSARHHVSLRMSLQGWRAMTTFGVRMMSISGMSVLAMRMSDVILGRILGLSALGLYARASNLSNLIYENVYGTATKVIFVQLAKDFRERGVLRDTFLRGFQLITALMWPMLLGLAILARPAIFILYGEKWLPAALPLSLLMIAQFFTLCFGMNWELFVLRDETATQTRYEITRSVLGIIVFSIGCLFSLAGAAIGRVMDALIGLVFYYPHVQRLARTEPGEIPRVYLESGMLAITAVLPSLGLMLLYDWSPRTPPLLIALAVIVGILLWLTLVFRLNHPIREEVMRVLRRFGGARFRTV